MMNSGEGVKGIERASDSRRVDFDNPPMLFLLEDCLKGPLGAPFMYDPFIDKEGGLRGDEHVLDFGCGGGVSTRTIARRLNGGGEVTGVDVSSRMLSRARKRLVKCENAQVLHGDVRHMDLGDRTFDVIVAIHVLHEISPEDRESTMAALRQLMSPGGRFWVLEFTREPHGINVGGIRKLMAGAGLKETSSESMRSQFRGVFVLPGSP
jgi:ubiquinone/menaquinone biosynthesis C-methylase UbiE